MRDTALLVIDVQAGMFNEPVYQGDELLANIGRLLDQARASQTPVIYVQHCSPPNTSLAPDTAGWLIHPALTPTPMDTIVQKQHPDAFQDTRLQAELARRDIKKLIITGMQTEHCIDTTCRRAYSLGYDVTLVLDAHSTFDTQLLPAAQIIAHHNAVLGDWFARLRPTSEIHLEEKPV